MIMEETVNVALERKKSKVWKKVLYERQPFPDNYVDAKFLHDLDMSTDSSRSPTVYGILLSTSVVVQQISAVAIFVAIHKFIMKHESFFWRLFLFDAYLLAVIYVIHRIFDDSHPTLKRTFKLSALFVLCLRVIAPALQTLTSSYSDDTIDALAIIFSFMHLAFHDYAYVNSTKDSYSGTVSLNAAMFTAVLLASRLRKIEMVTAFIVLAVIFFSLFPGTAKLIKRKSMSLHMLLTGSLWLIATFLLVHLHSTLLATYQIMIIFVWGVCPLWLYYLCVNYKKRMRGPWDIAEVPVDYEHDNRLQ